MKTLSEETLATERLKQAAAIAGGVLLAGTIAYWPLRRNVWGVIALNKAKQAAQKYVFKNNEKRFGDGTRDAVDQAGWESFPASDPPAMH